MKETEIEDCRRRAGRTTSRWKTVRVRKRERRGEGVAGIRWGG